MNIPIREIKTIQFSLETDENIKNTSIKNIKSVDLFDHKGIPHLNGVYSPKLGTTDHAYDCSTCKKPKGQCEGHYGHIRLNYPVYSPLVFDSNIKYLSMFCVECGDLIVDKAKLEKYSKNERFKKAYDSATNKQVRDNVKILKKQCPGCKNMQPIITKHPVLLYMFQVQNVNTEGFPIGKPTPFLTHNVKNVFDRVKMEDLTFLGIPHESHPKNFIFYNIKVPPPNIRPVVRKISSNKGTNDSLTSLLVQIIRLDAKLAGMTSEESIMEKIKTIEEITNVYFSFIKGTKSAKPREVGEHKSIGERMKGKNQILRNGLMGKRTRQTGRSVIANNPYIKPGEVLISLKFARILQCEEIVQEYNIHVLNEYFRNGTERYPGCTQIIKKSSGKTFKSDAKNQFLEIGDTIMRDVITGDFANINRAPTLLASNITAMRIVVSEDPNELIMGLNVIACPLFGADFDGDQMNILMNASISSRYEISRLSSIDNWFINYANSAPNLGQNYDSIVGLFMLTLSSTKLNRSAAMSLFSRCSIKPDLSEDRLYSGRELISMCLAATPINLEHSTSYYDKNLAKYIDYDPEDIKVVIKNGVLISGVLDKKTIGGGAINGIYNNIASDYGVSEALRVIYDMQQMAIEYNQIRGVSIGVKDVMLDKETNEEIAKITSRIMKKSDLFTDKLNKGEIIPPLGQTIDQFYESQQIEILKAYDDFNEPIMKAIDPASNNLLQLVLSGSKGKIEQFRNITAVGGQKAINGKRTTMNYGWKRTSPFHQRYVTDPVDRGYIANSYINGLTVPEMLTGFINSRYDFITIALTTAKTGYINRKAVKNFESINVNNYRWSVKGNHIVQFGYAEDMTDARRIGLVNLSSVFMNDEVLKKTYMYSGKSDLKSVEFAAIKADRDTYRQIYMDIESVNYKYVMSNSVLLPFDIKKIIVNVMSNEFTLENIKIPIKTPNDDDINTMRTRVVEFINELPYVLINETQRQLKSYIPDFLLKIVWLPSMSLRLGLCSNELIRMKVSPAHLEMILGIVKTKYLMSLVAPGAAVGIIASQAFSEPLSQYMLDAKHSSAAGGTTKSAMLKVTEILSARATKDLGEPQMILQIKNPQDKTKIQEIMNNIEENSLDKFLVDWQIFYEEFGKIVHLNYIDENADLARFVKLNPGYEPPQLYKWCIRFTVDKVRLILKNITIEFIAAKLRKSFPSLYIVYLTESSETIFIRAYFKINYYKTMPSLDVAKEVKNDILNMIVRGVSGIRSVIPVPMIGNQLKENGQIALHKDAFCIQTVGTNLVDILQTPGIDHTSVSTDALQEIAEVFGIDAARNQIMYQMKSIVDKCGYKHLSIYADEMTFNGKVTSVERSGMKKRDTASVFLKMGFDSPVQALRAAALGSVENQIDGLTSKLLMGSIPNYGTLYNNYIINEKVVKENIRSIDELIEEL